MPPSSYPWRRVLGALVLFTAAYLLLVRPLRIALADDLVCPALQRLVPPEQVDCAPAAARVIVQAPAPDLPEADVWVYAGGPALLVSLVLVLLFPRDRVGLYYLGLEFALTLVLLGVAALALTARPEVLHLHRFGHLYLMKPLPLAFPLVYTLRHAGRAPVALRPLLAVRPPRRA